MNEIHVIHKILCPLSSEFLMIDVGAHFGSSLSPFVNDGAIVHAFEPDSQNRDKLEKHLSKNHWRGKVFLDNRAVTDKDSKIVTFYRSKVSTGISGLSSFHESHQIAGKVETVTLRKYCTDNKISKVNFLKIDSEGYDLFVLKGFDWSRFHPRAVICEFEDSKTKPLGYDWKVLANYLKDIGYSIVISEWYPLIKYGGPHRWNCVKFFPSELKFSNAWGNLIAFSSQKDADSYMKICLSLQNYD